MPLDCLLLLTIGKTIEGFRELITVHVCSVENLLREPYFS